MTPTPMTPDLIARLRGLVAKDDDHMVASPEDIEWLIEQSVRWPTRIHPERTTNDRFLRYSMAATLLSALTEIERLTVALAEDDANVERVAQRMHEQRRGPAGTSWEDVPLTAKWELCGQARAALAAIRGERVDG